MGNHLLWESLNTCSLGGAKYKLREIGEKVVKEGGAEKIHIDPHGEKEGIKWEEREEVREIAKTPPATLITSERCSPSSRPLYSSMKPVRDVVT